MQLTQLSRRRFSQLLAGAGLGLVNFAANASIAKPEAGKEYRVLAQAQPVNAGDKIEVIEFFAYYCHFCHHLETSLAEWVKKQGDRIQFKRIHVLNPGVEAQQKLFFALDAIGKADELHNQVFEAYHVQRNRLMTDEQVRDFINKTNIDKAAFFSAYNSFTVKTKQGRSQRVMSDYEVTSWPTLIVDGRFQTSPSMAGSEHGRPSEDQANQALLPVLDWLVASAQKQKAATPK
ncbi:thiol:disulfide interchange protein DsbA/DsbL [Undibacterium seohonense]|jgi:thiol:disulfide interchange protein DsbA|uniref:Thiol:disulfide interchange protein DsbA n=1 Tax=Undibacterium seohonense TaxID=1344950 RepID=A0ABR6X1G1_9BURK|nr:thiol:disulfide interchange protein DsbA/DsbL [Undibacterium seohonense]MBC3806503.1 thiol:disulfide interchange protein DsbA/DsbL [Undibacterium seohonense]